MNQNAAERLVGDGQAGGFPVLHVEILGRGIQLVALDGFRLQGVVGTGLQRDVDAPVLPGGGGLDEAAVNLADFKADIFLF